jgi:hypothetical protein
MISLISFDDSHILERSKANELGLHYEEVTDKRLGICNGKIKIMSYDSYKYRDELHQLPDSLAYYSDKEVEVPSYNIYERLGQKDSAKDLVFVAKDNHMVDLLTFAPKCPYPFTINKSVLSVDTPVSNLNSILYTIEDKVNNLVKALADVEGRSFNSKCNVHVGGGLLVTFNELKLSEDTCTDALQIELNDGWRIVAVCVQPDQRRPDYILGRYNPSIDTTSETSAKR